MSTQKRIMMKPITLLTFLCISLTATFAQTKIIAHKSHSGSPHTFASKEYDCSFGLGNGYCLKQKKVITDSIKKLSNTSVIFYTHMGTNQLIDTMTSQYENYSQNIYASYKKQKKVKLINFKKKDKKGSIPLMSTPPNGNNRNHLLLFIGLLLCVFITWNFLTRKKETQVICSVK